jgi:hypothetical protein
MVHSFEYEDDCSIGKFKATKKETIVDYRNPLRYIGNYMYQYHLL